MRSGMTRVDDYLAFASLISAANKLMTEGKAPADRSLSERGLFAGMAHLNAYASCTAALPFIALPTIAIRSVHAMTRSWP